MARGVWWTSQDSLQSPLVDAPMGDAGRYVCHFFSLKKKVGSVFFVSLVPHKRAGWFWILCLVVSYWRKELDKPHPLDVSRNIGGISTDYIFNDLADFGFKY